MLIFGHDEIGTKLELRQMGRRRKRGNEERVKVGVVDRG